SRRARRRSGNSSHCTPRLAVGLARHRPGRGRDGAARLRLEPHALRRLRVARDVLRDGPRAFTDGRDGLRLRGDAVRRGRGRRVGDAGPDVRRAARRIARAGLAVLVAAALVAAPRGPAAQPDTRIPWIGYLANEPTPDSAPVLREALRKRDWIEGQSIKI